MGGPDTIHLAGNELCELALGHFYLPSGAPALKRRQLQLLETRAKFLLSFSFSDFGRAPLGSLAKGTKNTGVA